MGRCIEGEVFDFILSTAPFPQTARLAGCEDVPRAYAPCLTQILLYEAEWPGLTPQFYGISDRSGHPLAWSACENHKTGRVTPGHTVIVVQTSPVFSQARLEEDFSTWASEVRGLVEARWEIPVSAFRAMHTHRWRYARIAAPIVLPLLPEGWYFAGDLLTESRIESAWLAGQRVARGIVSAS